MQGLNFTAAEVLCWQQLPLGEHFLCAGACAVGEVGTVVPKVTWLRRRDVRRILPQNLRARLGRLLGSHIYSCINHLTRAVDAQLTSRESHGDLQSGWCRQLHGVTFHTERWVPRHKFACCYRTKGAWVLGQLKKALDF